MRKQIYRMGKAFTLLLVGLSPWVVKGKEIPFQNTQMTMLFHNRIDTVPSSVKKETDKTDNPEPTVKTTEKIKSVPKSRKQIKPAAVTPMKSVRPVKIKVVKPKILKPVTKLIP